MTPHPTRTAIGHAFLPFLAVPGLLLVTACGGEPADSPEAEPAAEAEAPEPTDADPDEPTASGFIEVTIDGETLRFDHTPAGDNELNRMALELQAQASPEDEHGFTILVMRPGIAQMELPYVFDGFGEEEMDAGEMAYRMTLVYKGPEERIWAWQRAEEEPGGVRIDRIEGRTVEGEILPGTYAFSPFEPGMEIEGGRFQIEVARRR